MNIQNLKSKIRPPGQGRGTNREAGMITVVFIALLAIMIVFVTVQSQALIRLRREVKLLEHQQMKHLNGPQTHAVATNPTPTK